MCKSSDFKMNFYSSSVEEKHFGSAEYEIMWNYEHIFRFFWAKLILQGVIKITRVVGFF